MGVQTERSERPNLNFHRRKGRCIHSRLSTIGVLCGRWVLLVLSALSLSLSCVRLKLTLGPLPHSFVIVPTFLQSQSRRVGTGAKLSFVRSRTPSANPPPTHALYVHWPHPSHQPARSVHAVCLEKARSHLSKRISSATQSSLPPLAALFHTTTISSFPSLPHHPALHLT